MKGLIHIYCGDGKGKTTAATGLAVRGAAYFKKVIFVQFLKDGTSNELKILKEIKNIDVRVCTKHLGFSWNMDDDTKKIAAEEYTKLFDDAVNEAVSSDADMILFDEIMACISCGFLSEEKVLKFLNEKPEKLEVVMTGRNPSKELIDKADYVSEIKKVKHPFDEGIDSREGIEY
ncbi:MAG: cob(I)yrinic acid a,c-diamide adenosyltransferase [Clostridium sp.]|nr:cob(I)yrinic acid a,c-diamide adenosyltransferase [Clostridium sp.]